MEMLVAQCQIVYHLEHLFVVAQKDFYQTLTDFVNRLHYHLQVVHRTKTVVLQNHALTEFVETRVTVAKTQNVSCGITDRYALARTVSTEIHTICAALLVVVLIQNVKVMKLVLTATV